MNDWMDDITKVIFESSFMTVATADDRGTPWATPVEFACDEELRFYWTSHVDSRHSRNVRANPRAALSIYDSTQTPGVRAEVQGVYAEGPVEEFRTEDLAAVRPSLGRWIEWREASHPNRSRAAADTNGDTTVWRQYRLTPEKLYALDPDGHPDIPGVRIWKVELDLAESFARAYRSRLRAGGGRAP